MNLGEQPNGGSDWQYDAESLECREWREFIVCLGVHETDSLEFRTGGLARMQPRS